MGEGSVEKGGGISGDSDKDKHGREEVHTFNSRKEFGYDIRKTKARPSNTAIIDVVLAFLRDTKVGIVKEESSMYVDLFLPPPPLFLSFFPFFSRCSVATVYW